jgi:hypothetical protein
LRDLLGVVDIKERRLYPDVLYRALSDANDHPEELIFILMDTPEGWQEDGWLTEYMRLSDLRAEGDVSGAVISVLPSGGMLDNGQGECRAEFSFPPNVILVLSVVGDGECGETANERANIVTLGSPDLSFDVLKTTPTSEGTTPTLLARVLAERYQQPKESLPDTLWAESWNSELIRMNALLEPFGAPIGYRLRNEILRYLLHAEQLSAQMPYGISFPLDTAFDYQICQRILPRVLSRLAKEEAEGDILGDLLMYAQGSNEHTPRFPHAAARLQSVHRHMD